MKWALVTVAFGYFLFLNAFMQPWQCILLIAVSLALFWYGTYYQDILDEGQAPSVRQIDEKSAPDANASASGRSPSLVDWAPQTKAAPETWAVHRVRISFEGNSTRFASLHSEALGSPLFLDKLKDLLDQSPTMKAGILSPFQSSAFKENDSKILRALFTTRSDEEGVFLVCRGHSMKTSRLLARTVMEAYRRAISEEGMDEPIISRFDKYRKKINTLLGQKEDLVQQIRSQAKVGTGADVEEIALQAELEEIESDLAALDRTLSQIDSVHRLDPNPMKLLEVEGVAGRENIPELTLMVDQLETMLVNESQDPNLQKEVAKHLALTRNRITKAIEKAIVNLKEETKSTLRKKKLTETELVELRANQSLGIRANPKFELLNRLGAEIQSQQEIYRRFFEEWEAAKSKYRFEEQLQL